MALSVQADETALELFRRTNRKPLRTGLAFLDEVKETPFIILLYSVNMKRDIQKLHLQ